MDMVEKDRHHLNTHELNAVTVLYVLESIRNGDRLQERLVQIGVKIGRTKAFDLCRQLKAKLKTVDSPANMGDLNTLIEHGVDRGHLDALSTVSAWIIKKFAPYAKGNHEPTIRNLKWQSYIMSLAPSITEPLDIWVLGELFSAREMYSDYQDKAEFVENIGIIKATPKMSHLVNYLMFKPFESRNKAKRYIDALAMKTIPEIPYEGSAIPPELMMENAPAFIKWSLACMLWHGIPKSIYIGEFDDFLLPTQKFLVGTVGKQLEVGFIGHKTPLTISEEDIEGFVESYWHESEEDDCPCIECTNSKQTGQLWKRVQRSLNPQVQKQSMLS